MALSPAEAAALYRDEHLSACQIAERFRMTKAGVEGILRKAGLGGLQWCPVHRTHEVL